MPTGTEIKNIILNVNGDDVKKKIEDYRASLDKAVQSKKELLDARAASQRTDWTKEEKKNLNEYNKTIRENTKQLKEMGKAYFEFLKTLPEFDQLILERNNPRSSNYWIHVSIRRNGHNRKEVIPLLNKDPR